MLVKMAKNSNVKKDAKNKKGILLNHISEMDMYYFSDSKDKNVIKLGLNYIIDGLERTIFGNTEAEINYIEGIFDKWIKMHEVPKDKNSV